MDLTFFTFSTFFKWSAYFVYVNGIIWLNLNVAPPIYSLVDMITFNMSPQGHLASI